jgi:hypothetical protein
MTAPTTCARAAVRKLHTEDAASAKAYLAQSKVGEWVGHTNQSMASGARAVVDGFDWYVSRDAGDGRPLKALDREADVSFLSGSVTAKLDVILKDGANVAGRVVLWDGPDFQDDVAPVMACAFAHALHALYPTETITTIGVWQARRQRLVEVPYSAAIAQTAAASAILARI